MSFEASNGLDSQLAGAETERDVVLPAGAKIDTDAGTIVDSGGVPIVIKSVIVTQSNGPSIRVFLARSLVIDDSTVSGANALAFVSYGAVTIQGKVELGGYGTVGGAGAGRPPAVTVGVSFHETVCQTSFVDHGGGGGGGNATAGGSGGGMGGAASSSFVPLVGGGGGGALFDTGGTLLDRGGGGGGAVQIISLHQIELMSHGFINIGGGGGEPDGGGGAGGTVILEAPVVGLIGGLTGITGNGGAGGGCGSVVGQDGSMSTTPAIASGCSSGNYAAGAGGTGLTQAAGALGCVAGGCLICNGPSGGGGSVGRLRVATKDGSYTSSLGPTLSIALSAATLTTK